MNKQGLTEFFPRVSWHGFEDRAGKLCPNDTVFQVGMGVRFLHRDCRLVTSGVLCTIELNETVLDFDLLRIVLALSEGNECLLGDFLVPELDRLFRRFAATDLVSCVHCSALSALVSWADRVKSTSDTISGCELVNSIVVGATISFSVTAQSGGLKLDSSVTLYLSSSKYALLRVDKWLCVPESETVVRLSVGSVV